MAFDPSKLKPASYNGVSFLIPDNRQDGGNRTVTHEFVGSNRTEVEILGQRQYKFTLKIYVHGSTYWETREKLLKELNKASYGTFIHPYEGQLTVAVVDGYTILENDREAGLLTLQTQFQVVTDKSILEVIPDAINQVAQQKAIAVKTDSAFDSFIESFSGITTDYVNNIDKAIEGVEQITGNMRAITKVAVSTITKVNELNSALNQIENDLNELIQTPSILAQSINSLYKTLTFFSDDPNEQVSVNSGLNNYDKGITATPLTAEQIENSNNQQALEMQTKGSALALSLQTSIYISYSTKEQLEEIRSANEALFDEIREDLTDDSFDALEDLRVSVNSFLDTLDVQETIKVKVVNESLTSFLMRWYGNIDYYEDIISLNSLVDTSNINQELTIYDQ